MNNVKREYMPIKIVQYSKLTGEEVKCYLGGIAIETIFTKIVKVLENAESCYPTFRYWLQSKVFTGLHDGTRDILFVFNTESPFRLLGVAILKNTNDEKKISSFRVYPEYQRSGIGEILMKRCFDVLEDDKPMITVPRDMSLPLSDANNCYSAFDKFMKRKFPDNFVLKQKLPNYYRVGFTEYVYNGFLPMKK